MRAVIKAARDNFKLNSLPDPPDHSLVKQNTVCKKNTKTKLLSAVMKKGGSPIFKSHSHRD